MAHLIAIALLVGLLPSGLAGPACAQKYKDTSDCIQRCSSKWGYPGLMMGNDPWGSVMEAKTGKTIDDFYLQVAIACGQPNDTKPMTPSSSAKPEPTLRQGLGTQATSSTSAPARFITSVRPSSSTTSTTKSSTSAKPSTSSTSTKPKTTSTTPPRPSFAALAQTNAFAAPPPATTQPKTNTDANNSKSNSNSNSNANANTNKSNSNSNANTNSNSGNKQSNSDSNSNKNTGSSGSTGNSGGSGGNGSRASNADVQAYLKGHNSIRAKHGAVDVTWSNEAAAKAQQWADLCTNQHSGGTLGPFGENLAAGTGSYSISEAVKDWTDEVTDYNPGNPKPSHFTQVVWKATTQIGCAVQTCSGIFPGFGPAQYYVCEYSRQGNVIGQFGQNVQA
ncbi:SCP domain-containing protein [Mycena indigotica]|uniref:SCP domain-containing protein n=1 Tax=Mycena indigotica TaxID=2126181 RepID=A0A8H6W895_9AGAR|nr:SCP domain-containing protein [Mycena indigotica]KAF7306661.1 SCP domain-containing protein [Mycena indigotica]